MINLFWDLYQQRQISSLQRQTGASRADAEIAARQTIHRESERLEARVDRLVLLVHAMWTLFREKTDVTEEDLLKRATELDAEDGTIDGRISRPPVPCAECGAMISRKFNRCLFCGEEYRDGSALETV